MQFISQDLTGQYISSSYQDLVQAYVSQSSIYFLNGYGDVIAVLPSASLGQLILTQDQTASWASSSVSSSWANFANSSISASWAPGSNPGTTIVTGSIYQITSSWANLAASASWVPNLYPQIEQISSSWASSSLSSSYVLSASWAGISISSSYVLSASWADISLSASYVPNLYPQTVQISASWASASISASYAKSASWAPFVAVTSVSSASWASSSISASYVPNLYPQAEQISSSWASASISSSYALSASWAPTTFLTTGSTYPITASWANSASFADSASYINPSVFNSLILPFEFTYKNVITSGDPGKGNFRYNSLSSGSITQIYLNSTTNGGLDITGIINSLKSGSYSIYVQQKTDSTKASLFAVSSIPINNTGWFTIPVSYLSSGDNGLPTNNAVCAFLVINKNAIVPGETYQVTASWAISASWVPNIYPQTVQISASWASASLSSSYALSASWAPDVDLNIITGSLVPITSSWAEHAITAAYADTCSVFIYSNITQSFTSIAISASWASASISTSYSPTSVSASYSFTASYTPYARYETTLINNSTSSILELPNNMYNSVFVNYMMTDGTNFRAGNIVTIYTTASLNFTEICTTDIGNSTGLHVNGELSNSFVKIYGVNNTNTDYTLKYHYNVM